MQENLVILNLWMEKKYKNYTHLTKKNRRLLYANADCLKQDFLAHVEQQGFSADSGPASALDSLQYLKLIMDYLKPGKRYEYQASANFGKLLKNPQHEKLVGDCNQIVTLYTYLYSLRFPIGDLQIKILPQHVCLHFKDIDIEATTGTLQDYKTFEHLLPITELITTNVLDVVDAEAQTQHIDSRTMLKRAQFAHHISSLRDLVTQNLDVAYSNLGLQLLRSKQFDSALFFLERSHHPELLKTAWHQATVYFVKKNRFSKAAYYAKRSGNPELVDYVALQEGVYFYRQKNYRKALSYFERLNDERMAKACYQGLYNQLAKTVRSVKTLGEAKRYTSTYRKMQLLAQKAHNDAALQFVENILKQL